MAKLDSRLVVVSAETASGLGRRSRLSVPPADDARFKHDQADIAELPTSFSNRHSALVSFPRTNRMGEDFDEPNAETIGRILAELDESVDQEARRNFGSGP